MQHTTRGFRNVTIFRWGVRLTTVFLMILFFGLSFIVFGFDKGFSESYEPIIVKFDTTQQVSGLATSGVTKQFIDESSSGGKKYVHLDGTNSQLEITNLATLTGEFSLSDYKYIKFSYRRTGNYVSAEYSQLFFDLDTSTSAYDGYKYFTFDKPESGQERWVTSVLSINDAQQYNSSQIKHYDQNGIFIGNGTAINYNAEWSGTVQKFRFIFSRWNDSPEQRSMDFEYIAFFHTLEEAEAYPLTVEEKQVVGALATMSADTGRSVAYYDGDTQSKAENAVRSYISTYSNASITLSNIEYTAPTEVAGSITCKVKLGDDEENNNNSAILTWEIEEMPGPIVAKFDSQSVVNNATVYGGTKSFVDESESGGKKYISLSGTADNIYFVNVQDFTGNFSLDFYTHIKISYRREGISKTQSGEYTLLYFNNGAATGYKKFKLNSQNEGETAEWETAVISINEGTLKRYNKDGLLIFDGTFTNGDTNPWTGTAEMFRLDLSRYISGPRTIDLEYVGVFHTQEEAIAYPYSVEEYKIEGALNVIKSAGDIVMKYDDGATLEGAEQAIKNYVAQYTDAVCSLYNIDYTAPTETEDGRIQCTIKLGNGELSQNNSMELDWVIGRLPNPVIWAMDNYNFVSKLSSFNSIVSLENGYARLLPNKVGQEDGYCLEASDIWGDVQLSEFPIIKIRYQRKNSEDAVMQIFWWIKENSNYGYRQFNGGGVADDGDWMEITLDMSKSAQGAIAVYLTNITDGTTSTSVFTSGQGEFTGTLSQFRFNFGRKANLNRDTLIEYIGVFKNLEQANACSVIAEQRLDETERQIQNSEISLSYGEGSNKQYAEENLLRQFNFLGGCSAELVSSTYLSPTKKETGTLIVELNLISAGQTKSLTYEAEIAKAFDEPVLWAFNNQEFIDKLYLPTPSATKLELENGVMKATNLTPEVGTGFEFYVEMPKATDNFVLQDYPFMKIKYKRLDPTYCYLYFYSDTVTSAQRQFGLGIEEDTWYTTVINLAINNKTDTALYHTNLKTGEKTLMTLSNTSTDVLNGTAYKIRLNMGALRFHKRVTYIEYIAFFPTLEAANAYDEKSYIAESNATQVLESINREKSVDFTQANTLTKAEQTARLTLLELLKDCESISIADSGLSNEMFDVKVKTKSYVEPVVGDEDGRYVCDVYISNPEYNLWASLGEFTLNISSLNVEEKLIWTFNNAEFINGLKFNDATGSLTDDDMMKLESENSTFGFTYDAVGNAVFPVHNNTYIRIILSSEQMLSNVKVSINANDFCELSSISAGNSIIELDCEGGELFVGGIKHAANVALVGELIKNFGLTFTTDGDVYIESIGFFQDKDDADDFVAEALVLSEELQQIGDSIDNQTFTVANADGVDEDAAKVRAEEIINTKLSGSVELYRIEVTSFVAPTEETQGSAVIKAVLAYGPSYSREYMTVNYTLSISKTPTEPVVWTFDEEFVKSLTGQGGAELSSSDNMLIVKSKTGLEDSFGFNLTVSEENAFYLQDYPFVKIKINRTGYKDDSATGAGTAQLYFWNDETDGTPSRQFRMGTSAAEGKWSTVIIDMNNGGWFYILEDDAAPTKIAFTGSSGHEFSGLLTRVRFTLGRQITVDRLAQIEYIAFCTTKEQAISYNGDGYVESWEVKGNESAITQTVVDKAKTIEAKIRLETTQVGKVMTIITDKAENASYTGLYVGADGQLVYVYDGVSYSTEDVNLFNGKWAHVAVVHDGTDIKLYVDGEEKAHITATENDGDYANALIIGSEYDGSNQFCGRVREICLWSVARSQAQLKTNVLSKYDKTQNGLIAAWDLYKAVDGQFSNTVSEENCAIYQDGLNRQYHEFTGEDYLISSETVSIAPKTIELWVKPHVVAYESEMVLVAGGNTKLSINANGELEFTYGGVKLFTTQDINMMPYEWAHIAVTIDNNVAKLYKDGQLFGTYSDLSAGSVDACKYTIGADNETQFFLGGICSVNLWSVVLSETEIQNSMNAYKSGTEDNLIASWRIDTQDYLQYSDCVSGNSMILTSEGWYKKDLTVPEDSFTIVHIPDIQNLHVTNPEYIEGIMRWTQENAERLNILFSVNVGDATQNASRYEWSVIREAYEYLDGVVPYWIALGNHDYPNYQDGRGSEIRDSYAFREYFDIAERMAQSDFGGAFEDDRLDNAYFLYTENGQDYMLIVTEYKPRDEVLTWADQVISAHPNHKVIIATHGYFRNETDKPEEKGQAAYLETNGVEYLSEYDTTINQGITIREKLVKKHSNIMLVTSGHSQGVCVYYRADEGEQGNVIFEVLSDTSAMIDGFPSSYDLICIYNVKADGEIRTCYYSPVMDMYYDTYNENLIITG